MDEEKRAKTAEDDRKESTETAADDWQMRFVVERRPKVKKKKRKKKKFELKPTIQLSLLSAKRKATSMSKRIRKLWTLWARFTEAVAKRNAENEVEAEYAGGSGPPGVPGFEEISCIEAEVPDIMITDTDKVRTSCKQCADNPPSFPTKEEIKRKLIAVDKYYGVTSSNRTGRPKGSNSLEPEGDYIDEGALIRPSWRFILERPLVEQYVLMTNYIRKVSALAELNDGAKAKSVEEPDSGEDDVEIDKFTRKHISETERLLKSLKEPRNKEISVQTNIKLTDEFKGATSETSLYPDSNASGSIDSNDLSVATIVTSRDLSSPLQSDADSRITTEINPATASTVKWWESREHPQMSESFQTSVDSARGNMSSGSDGLTIPVHSVHGKTSLAPPHDSPESTIDKPLQKKVTFSSVVQYFQAPEKNSAVYRLPPDELIDMATPINQPKNYEKPTMRPLNQPVIVLGHPALKLVEKVSVAAEPPPNHLPKFPRLNSSINSTSEELSSTSAKCSSEDVHFVQLHQAQQNPERIPAPGRSPEQCIILNPANTIYFKANQSSADSEESSSTSGERIALKASPAGFFQNGKLVISAAPKIVDVFYPEVPDFTDIFNEKEDKLKLKIEEPSPNVELNSNNDSKKKEYIGKVVLLTNNTLTQQSGSVATYTSSIIKPLNSGESIPAAVVNQISVPVVDAMPEEMHKVKTEIQKEDITPETGECVDQQNEDLSAHKSSCEKKDMQTSMTEMTQQLPIVDEVGTLTNVQMKDAAVSPADSLKIVTNNESANRVNDAATEVASTDDQLLEDEERPIQVKYEVMPYVKRIAESLIPLPWQAEEANDLHQGKIIDMPKISRSIEELKSIFEKKSQPLERAISVARVGSRSVDLSQSPIEETENGDVKNQANKDMSGVDCHSQLKEKSENRSEQKVQTIKEERDHEEHLQVIKASQIFTASSAHVPSEDRVAKMNKDRSIEAATVSVLAHVETKSTVGGDSTLRQPDKKQQIQDSTLNLGDAGGAQKTVESYINALLQKVDHVASQRAGGTSKQWLMDVIPPVHCKGRGGSSRLKSKPKPVFKFLRKRQESAEKE